MTGLHRFDEHYDPESYGYAQYDDVAVTESGRLEVADGFLLESSKLHVDGVLELNGSLSQLNVSDSSGTTGRAYFAENASISVRNAATLWANTSVSGGASILVDAPGGAEGGIVESTQIVFERFSAEAGHTEITAGGGSPDETVSSAVCAAAFDVGTLEISEGASLSVQVGYGGRFMTGGVYTATESSTYLPAGGIAVFQKRTVLSPSFRVAIGGSDAARAAADAQGWSLWVGEGGTLALEGKNAAVTVGEGGSARFENGSTLWIVDGGIAGLREGESFEITMLDLKGAYVSGLENLSFRIDGEPMEGSLYLDNSGKLIGVAGSLSFEGPFASILSELYAERKSVTTSDFYRRLFTFSPETASHTMAALASAGSVSGTDERMLMGAAGISLRLREALRTAERHVERAQASRAAREAEEKEKKAREASSEERTESDSSDWFAGLSEWKEDITRKMPEVMQDIPLLLAGFAGNSRTDVSRPLIGGKHRTKSDDAGFEAAVILGKNDWRFGAAGTFITRDIEVQGERGTGRQLAIEAESDEMAVSLFARCPLWDGFLTADVTWQEASDAYRTPMNDVILLADDVKRTSYSAGIFYEQPLGNYASWSFSGFGGLRYVTSDKAEIRWKAPSGEILSVQEGKRSAFIGTIGGAASAGIDFEPATGWLGSYKPRRMDAGLSAALHAVSADGRKLTASAPGAQSSADCGRTGDADLLQASAEISAGIEWQETRFEIAGWAYRAGSDARAFGGTARLSWRLNAL